MTATPGASPVSIVATDGVRVVAGLDRNGLGFESQVFEHEGGGQDGTHRVRDVLAGVLRGRPVHRLEHGRPARMEVAGSSQSEPALQLGS